MWAVFGVTIWSVQRFITENFHLLHPKREYFNAKISFYWCSCAACIIFSLVLISLHLFSSESVTQKGTRECWVHCFLLNGPRPRCFAFIRICYDGIFNVPFSCVPHAGKLSDFQQFFRTSLRSVKLQLCRNRKLSSLSAWLFKFFSDQWKSFSNVSTLKRISICVKKCLKNEECKLGNKLSLLHINSTARWNLMKTRKKPDNLSLIGTIVAN